MTIDEFSNSFDTLVNSYAHRIEFGNQISNYDLAFDEYEKSVFLTKAQEDLVISLYNGRNSIGLSFEETEEMRRYLANLVKDNSSSPIENSTGTPLGSYSKFFQLPSDVWFIVYESITTIVPEGESCAGNMIVMDVIPATHDEFHRIKKNPFRGPNKRRALRLDLAEGVVEISCKYPDIRGYYCRYLRKPKPIVLEHLTSEGDRTDLEIGGINTPSPCELHEALHQKILERAVLLAIQSRGAKTKE